MQNRTTWPTISYLASIPVELEEAALVDGAKRFQALRKS
jgi:ABC-type maltose transport system permease subunit